MAELTLPFEHDGKVLRYSEFIRAVLPSFSTDEQFGEWGAGSGIVAASGSIVGFTFAPTPAGSIDYYHNITTSIVGASGTDIILNQVIDNIAGGQQFISKSRITLSPGQQISFMADGAGYGTSTARFSSGKAMVCAPGSAPEVITTGAIAAGHTLTMRFIRERRPGPIIGQFDTLDSEIS